MVRYRGIELVCQRMCAKEIEVGGEGMRLWSLTGPGRNGCPIQSHACEVCQLDLLPLTKSVNPCFHPVMIRRHGDEQRQECSERQISAVIPIELVKGYGGDQTNEENRQPPPGERCAGPGSLNNEAVSASDHRLNLDDA